ncbi:MULTISPECIES: FAD-dependent monooxygenase [Rhizobium/Agrobacterium group]|uniref:FAD-dependent monooxygenase n=1 Tax=Rhizobium/Agrobacterium group TaxID=227290 RepID=UPI0022B8436E|nr:MULTISPECIES: FAD-dependent monooxygenase [Rhizobium/Agrobacterium group]MCZ7889955.1 FAD-dependent monooxygenase [Agrobacterium salinitolerans]MDA5636456.1 FAD-dependent monooxygenase [Agrobacterium sp. ST15.16.024]MDF1892328.1 FAD-dependent monooxygenase [Rhizobium rhizogenes]
MIFLRAPFESYHFTCVEADQCRRFERQHETDASHQESREENLTEKKRILIVGAGIGGLTAAGLLLMDGHDVHVFEQAPELGEVGAGIQVSANATRVLDKLGILDALEEAAVHPLRIEFRLHDTAEIVSQIMLGDEHRQKFGAPYLHVYRPDILRLLVQRVRQLSLTAMHLNKSATHYVEDTEGVTLHFKDGTSERGDVLIGADGIKSVVRAQMHGNEPANFTGNVAWRVMVPVEKLPPNFQPPIFVNWMGPQRHMVVYWVNGGRVLNFVGCVEKPEWSEEGWTVKAPWEALKVDYAGFHQDVQTMIDAADRDKCFCWALNNRPRLPFWSTSRVTLLGDSAHPTLPYMAQGAVMAIEDGAVLARALFEYDNLEQALSRYETARIDRTSRIVNESTEHAKLYHLDTHQEFRDAFSRKDPGKDRAGWLYNYDPLSVPLEPVNI